MHIGNSATFIITNCRSLSIAAKSENPDVAAAYIDWMTNDDAAQMLERQSKGIARGDMLGIELDGAFEAARCQNRAGLPIRRRRP